MNALAAHAGSPSSPAPSWTETETTPGNAITAQTALAQRRLLTTLTLAIMLHALTLALAIELPGAMAPAQRIAVQIIGNARQAAATLHPAPVAEPTREPPRESRNALPPEAPPTPGQASEFAESLSTQNTPTDSAPATGVEASDVAAPAASEPLQVPARVDTAYLDNPRPAYPPLSRKLGEEGTVVLRVDVNADGMATAVVIERSCGFPRLDEAARKVALRWRFVAARRGDLRESSTVRVPIRFSLSTQ